MAERLDGNDNWGEENTVQFRITFDGLDAAKSEILLPQFITALSGWHEFIQLASAIHFTRKLTALPLPTNVAPAIKMRPIRKGSVETDFLLMVAAGALGQFLGARMDKNIPSTTELFEQAKFDLSVLWQWIKTLFDFHVEQKKALKTITEVELALEELARQHQIGVPEKPECYALVNALDVDLKRATEPIENVAETITVETKDIKIAVTPKEKRTLHSGFYISKTDSNQFTATVSLLELNIKTGHMQGTVETSGNPLFCGTINAYIKDDMLNVPRNPYTNSFNDKTPLHILVTPKYNLRTGTIAKWEVRHTSNVARVLPTRNKRTIDLGGTQSA